MGLNCMGPLIFGFFSINIFYSTTLLHDLRLVGCGTMYKECQLWIFHCVKVGTATPV